MQKSLGVLLVLVISVFKFGYSQNHGDFIKSNHTVISGHIKNLHVQPDIKEILVLVSDFTGSSTTFHDSIKSDGTFKVDFNLDIAQDIKIDPIDLRIIAHPGDSIHLDIDLENSKHINFSGDSQKSNQDLFRYLNSNYSILGMTVQEVSRVLDPEKYKLYADSIKNELSEKRIAFIKEAKPTKEIEEWTKDYINIRYYTSLWRHASSHLDNDTNLSCWIPPEYCFDFMTGPNEIFNKTVLNTESYILLQFCMIYFLPTGLSDKADSKINNNSILAKDILLTQKYKRLKQLIIGNILYQMLALNKTEYFENNMSLYKEQIQEPFIKRPIEQLYSKLKISKIPSSIKLINISSVDSESVLEMIIAQHKGKVIYVDCWATWCGPCKAEMPNSKKMMEKYKGKDIEFVYACIDSPEGLWKLNLSELQLSGSNYLLNHDQSNSFRNRLKITGIPFYILINRKGEIVSSGNYLNPMKLGTTNKIDKLLNEI
jgi:thiol-disulfide isomerase/thioredoxin